MSDTFNRNTGYVFYNNYVIIVPKLEICIVIYYYDLLGDNDNYFLVKIFL